MTLTGCGGRDRELLLPDELRLLGKHVVAAAMFVANIVLWRESGYFDTAAEFKPLLHLWSLGIEEQFYLVWPAILVTLWRHRKLLVGVLWTLVVTSFAFSVVAADDQPGHTYSLALIASRRLRVGALCDLSDPCSMFISAPITSRPSSRKSTHGQASGLRLRINNWILSHSAR